VASKPEECRFVRAGHYIPRRICWRRARANHLRKLLQKAELGRRDVPDRPVHTHAAYLWRAWLFAWRQEVSLAIESHNGVSFLLRWREGVRTVQVRRRGCGPCGTGRSKTKSRAAVRRSSALIPSPGSTQINYIVMLGKRLPCHTFGEKSRGNTVDNGLTCGRAGETSLDRPVSGPDVDEPLSKNPTYRPLSLARTSVLHILLSRGED
jgi:hypothetical protein